MENILDVSYKNNGSYKVVIRKDYDELGPLIKELFPNLKRICIVSDTNVAPKYAENVKAAVSGCADLVTEYVFPAGEASKTLSTVNACYEKLLSDDFYFCCSFAIWAIFIDLRKRTGKIQPLHVCREGIPAVEAEHLDLVIAEPMKCIRV